MQVNTEEKRKKAKIRGPNKVDSSYKRIFNVLDKFSKEFTLRRINTKIKVFAHFRK